MIRGLGGEECLDKQVVFCAVSGFGRRAYGAEGQNFIYLFSCDWVHVSDCCFSFDLDTDCCYDHGCVLRC